MKIEIDVSQPDKLFRGNSLDFNCHLNIDLTGYKITAEVFDQYASSIYLANTAAGGSDDEIEFTDDGTDGEFDIHVAKDLTKNFHLISFIEIDIEDADGKVQTVYFAPLKFTDNIYYRC